MSKQEKEFKRRVRKMTKHVEALRGLTEIGENHNALDEIDESLAFLRGDHPMKGGDTDRDSLSTLGGVRSGLTE